MLILAGNNHAQKHSGNPKDIDIILTNIDLFSSYYINGQYKKLAECYTVDGKIFPDKTDIIEGTDQIEKRWILPKDVKILDHKITPLEIKIIDDHAYDYGYYEGSTLLANGNTVSWKGKYVIVWRKENNNWKIYLDSWNRIDP